MPSRAQRTSEGRRRRLDPLAREEEIVTGAVSYFSQFGFDASMRDLASRLGISHGLLFRYFPTKETLVEAVYERVFLGRWEARWDALLTDPEISLAGRLTRFYGEYLAAIDRPEWMRTFIYGGLAGVGINRRYLGLIQKKVISPVAVELDVLSGGTRQGKPSDQAMDLSWGLHGEIIYPAIRKWIYGMNLVPAKASHINLAVDAFLGGAPAALRDAKGKHLTTSEVSSPARPFRHS